MAPKVNLFGKSQGKLFNEHETFNIMGSILNDVAEFIEAISLSLAGAIRGSYSDFLTAYSKISAFNILIKSYYGMNRDESEILDLKLNIVDRYRELNKYDKGIKFLGDIFSTQLKILKRGNAIFPQKRKSMSFHDFVRDETK